MVGWLPSHHCHVTPTHAHSRTHRSLTQGLIESHDLGVKASKIHEALMKLHPVKVKVTTNYRMLQKRPGTSVGSSFPGSYSHAHAHAHAHARTRTTSSACLDELPERIFQILEDQGTAYTVSRQFRLQNSLEIILMPLKPS